MLFIANTISTFATNVNGRFVVISTDSSKLEVLLQINTNTGSDDLGGATIVVGFDNHTLNFSNNPQVNTNYIFHNFNGGNYNSATITKPAINRLWLNIDLLFEHSNSGSIVNGNNDWTDVVTLFFDIINTNDSLKLDWLTTNPYWGIYDANNTTLWRPDTFQKLEYAVNDVTAPEIISASLLDSEKLEILFSESVDTSSALNISNYSINNGISILSGVVSTNRHRVTLTTTSHIPGKEYTIIVSNVKDLAGNLISSQNNLINYSDSSENNEDDDVIPLEFSLLQNYPNPFNPTTKITWQSPVAAHQSLKVYDVLGNEVATLVDEFKAAGSYEVNFEAFNLASGIYIYRLTSDNFSATKKMMLLR